MPSVIAAGGAELSGVASSVTKAGAQLTNTAVEEIVTEAAETEVAMPSVIAAGGAELSGAASSVEERKKKKRTWMDD